MRRLADPLTRFMAKVAVDETGCWLWQGAITRDGYGHFDVTRHWQGSAHRCGYELMVGPVPKGLQLDHLCRVRRCVNPAHLEAVTPRENSLRSQSPWARNAAKTHCPQGHEYDEANTLRVSGGRRRCRECARASNRAQYRRRKMERQAMAHLDHGVQ